MARALLMVMMLTPFFLYGQMDSLSGSRGQYILIEADIDSAIVFVDDEPAGTTPLILDSLPAGVHLIRVQHRFVERWLYPVLQDTVELRTGDSLHLKYRLVRRFSIRSIPFGAEVMRGENILGTTPLFIETVPEDTLVLKLPGYRAHPVELHSAADGHLLVSLERLEGTLPPEYLLGESGRGGPELLPLLLTGGSMLVSGVFSAHFKVQADEAYSRYLATGDPVKRAETRRLDAVAGLALATTTMFLGLFTYLLLSP